MAISQKSLGLRKQVGQASNTAMACTSTPASRFLPEFPLTSLHGGLQLSAETKPFLPRLLLVVVFITAIQKQTNPLSFFCCWAVVIGTRIPLLPYLVPGNCMNSKLQGETLALYTKSLEILCEATFSPLMELSHPQSRVPSTACGSFILSCPLLPVAWGKLMGSSVDPPYSAQLLSGAVAFSGPAHE